MAIGRDSVTPQSLLGLAREGKIIFKQLITEGRLLKFQNYSEFAEGFNHEYPGYDITLLRVSNWESEKGSASIGDSGVAEKLARYIGYTETQDIRDFVEICQSGRPLRGKSKELLDGALGIASELARPLGRSNANDTLTLFDAVKSGEIQSKAKFLRLYRVQVRKMTVKEMAAATSLTGGSVLRLENEEEFTPLTDRTLPKLLPFLHLTDDYPEIPAVSFFLMTDKTVEQRKAWGREKLALIRAGKLDLNTLVDQLTVDFHMSDQILSAQLGRSTGYVNVSIRRPERASYETAAVLAEYLGYDAPGDRLDFVEFAMGKDLSASVAAGSGQPADPQTLRRHELAKAKLADVRTGTCSVAEYFDAICEGLDVSRSGLSLQMGLDRHAVGQFIRNKRPPTIECVSQFSDVLGHHDRQDRADFIAFVMGKRFGPPEMAQHKPGAFAERACTP